MGGRKLVHVCIIVAAIFDFMTEEDPAEKSNNTWRFLEQNHSHALSVRKRLHCRLGKNDISCTNNYFLSLLS